MNPATAKIGATIQQYQVLLGKSNGKSQHITYPTYMEYESDLTGGYNLLDRVRNSRF
jgi:hypothetical protein